MEIIEIPPVALCILDLVLNSLQENSSCIAIRIYKEKKELQIVDNGIGIPVNVLADTDYDTKNNIHDLQSQYNLRNNTLIDIRKHFCIVTISSRYHSSTETYKKIYKKGLSPSLLRVVSRPSSGTTVILHNYLEGIYVHKQIISVTCFLIASISLNNHKVSFTVRDEYDIYLQIVKESSPIQVLKLLYKGHTLNDFIWNITCTKVLSIQYHGYIGLIKNQEKAMHFIFLNNRPVHCSTIINTILTYFLQNLSLHMEICNITKEMLFLIFFINCPSTEFIITIRNDKRVILLYKIRDVLDSIRTYINNIFLNEFFLKKLCECVQHYIPKQVQNMNLSMNFQKVYDVQPLLFYKLDCSHNNYKTKKSILYTTNINHNPITVFYTKYGMYIYESQKEKTLEESYIIDIPYNRADIKTNNYVKRKQETPNIDYNQYYLEKNISNNFIKYFNLKENIENKNDINRTSTNTMLNPNTTFPIQQEYINTDKNVDQLKISQELCTPKSNSYGNNFNCSLSEWSDWSYHSNSANHCIITMQNALTNMERPNESNKKYYTLFDFLPEKLNNLLRYKSIKLTKISSLKSFERDCIPAIELLHNNPGNRKHQDIDIHPCASTQHFYEFRLKRTALKFIKVINQVNRQLIVAIMNYDRVKLLLMMDQHAVHERIRYENLLIDYKTVDHTSFLTKRLSVPIIIEVTVNMCTILLWNKMLLHKFGIILSAINDNTLCVHSVPKCFIKNKHYYNDIKLIITIKNLLTEIVESIINNKGTNILPLSIHNAISMEACHGAIKFGDLLSLEQCINLFNDLKNTKSPTRCAHGRPSIIPIIELSELRRKCYKNMEKRLNLGSLKSSR